MRETHRRTAALLFAGLLLVTGVTFSPAVAAQEGDSSLLGDAVSSIEDTDGDGMRVDDGARAYGEAIKASIERFRNYNLRQINPLSEGSPTTASEEMAAVQAYFNDHNGTYESYTWLQNNTDASESHDTIEVQLTIDEETETRYLLSNATGENYTEIRMVNSTDRTVDDRLHVCGYAAEQAEEELQHFTEEYAAADEPPTQEYVGTLSGKYKSDVESTLLPTGGECEEAS